MHIFHKWTKWQIVTFLGKHYFPWTGKILDFKKEKQERSCLTCGKTERREI